MLGHNPSAAGTRSDRMTCRVLGWGYPYFYSTCNGQSCVPGQDRQVSLVVLETLTFTQLLWKIALALDRHVGFPRKCFVNGICLGTLNCGDAVPRPPLHGIGQMGNRWQIATHRD